jgi:opacity protein-like surface antigen
MKRLLLVAMIVLLAVGVMNAGERMTKAGTWSLNFTVNGLGDFGVIGAPVSSVTFFDENANLQSATLYGFGGSYFLNDDMALRANLTFNNTNQNVKNTGGESDLTMQAWGITPAFLWYMGGDGPVAAYWGPQVSYSMISAESETTPVSGTGTTETGKGTTFGVGVVMGAQWWAWDQVAFNAEYTLGYSSTTTEYEVTGGTTSDGPTFTDFGISNWAVGLGFYFAR